METSNTDLITNFGRMILKLNIFMIMNRVKHIIKSDIFMHGLKFFLTLHIRILLYERRPLV